jgi:hypothetical protein
MEVHARKIIFYDILTKGFPLPSRMNKLQPMAGVLNADSA